MPQDGRKQSSHFLVLPGLSDAAGHSTVPPHLAEVDWITHEARAAKMALKDVRKQLRKLEKKLSEDNVHKTRVALRRWFSIWKVLAEDGWQTAKCKRELIKPLKRLQSLLGDLRDLDVNMQQGERLGCTKKLIDQWASQREKQQRTLESYVETHGTKRLAKRLDKYLSRRAHKIAAALPRAKAHQSAFDHLELYLLAQESVAREWADMAQTPEELHKLRLAIKRWRYLLTEFFGVTNLELVAAQQVLGQMHDLDRLTPVLLHDDEQLEALIKLKERRRELLAQIEEMRVKLPYGLRPQVTSTKSAAVGSTSG